MLKSTLSNDAIFLDLNLIRNIDTREKLYPKEFKEKTLVYIHTQTDPISQSYLRKPPTRHP